MSAICKSFFLTYKIECVFYAFNGVYCYKLVFVITLEKCLCSKGIMFLQLQRWLQF